MIKPRKYEKLVSDFLTETRKKAIELLKKPDSPQFETSNDWQEWKSDVYKDDFIDSVSAILKTTEDYYHLQK